MTLTYESEQCDHDITDWKCLACCHKAFKECRTSLADAKNKVTEGENREALLRKAVEEYREGIHAEHCTPDNQVGRCEELSEILEAAQKA